MTSNRRYQTFYFILILLAFQLGGCIKKSSPLFYHTLSSSTQSASVASVSLPNILVGPVRVASFLNQGHLVRQTSAYSLSLSEQHRWAGNLPEMIADILHSNLSLDLGSEKIYTFPSRNNLEGLQLEIHFLHFEGDEYGRAKVAARWKIISTETQAVLHTKKSTYTMETKTGNYDDLAGGLSHGLSLLSREIIEKIVAIQPEFIAK